jgi:hypothetical protein
LGLETMFYCLRFETSLFVASYVSQGHGWGIRLRLDTGLQTASYRLSLYRHHANNIENTSHSCNVFYALPSNELFTKILSLWELVYRSMLQ